MAQIATPVQASIIVEPPVYELPEIGNHVVTVTEVADLGIVHSDVYGDKHKIRIRMRIEDEKTSEDEEIFVFQTCNIKMTPKTSLGIFLTQLGLPLAKFDLAELVGMRINANIVYNTNGDKTYANVSSVSRIRTPKTGTTPVVDPI
jgi:hypothetical protein